MTEKSEVYIWLKSSSPSMKLERLLLEFENRGFLSRRSLAYVKSESRFSRLLISCCWQKDVYWKPS